MVLRPQSPGSERRIKAIIDDDAPNLLSSGIRACTADLAERLRMAR